MAPKSDSEDSICDGRAGAARPVLATHAITSLVSSSVFDTGTFKQLQQDRETWKDTGKVKDDKWAWLYSYEINLTAWQENTAVDSLFGSHASGFFFPPNSSSGPTAAKLHCIKAQ